MRLFIFVQVLFVWLIIAMSGLKAQNAELAYFSIPGPNGEARKVQCTTKIPTEYLGKYSNKIGQFIILNADGTGVFKMSTGIEVTMNWGMVTGEDGNIKKSHTESQGDTYQLVFQSTNAKKFDNEHSVKTFTLRLNNGMTVPTDYRNMICINNLCK